MKRSRRSFVSVKPATAVRETAPHMVASVNYSNADALSYPDANRRWMGTEQQQVQVERPFFQLKSRGVPNHMLNTSNVPGWEGAGYGQNGPMGMSSNVRNRLMPDVSRTVQLSRRPMHGSSSMAKMSQTYTNRMVPYPTSWQHMTRTRQVQYNPMGQQYGANAQPNLTVIQVNHTLINIQNNVDIGQLTKEYLDYFKELDRRLEYFEEIGRRWI